MSPFWRDLIGEEAGEPAGGEFGGEGEAEGGSGAFGRDNAFCEERGDDSAGLALATVVRRASRSPEGFVVAGVLLVTSAGAYLLGTVLLGLASAYAGIATASRISRKRDAGGQS